MQNNRNLSEAAPFDWMEEDPEAYSIDSQRIRLLNEIERLESELERSIHLLIRRQVFEFNLEFADSGYYLTAEALKHIKNSQIRAGTLPGSALQFTIPLPELLKWVRECWSRPVCTQKDSGSIQVILNAGKMIGYESSGLATTLITVICSQAGAIMDIYPGYGHFANAGNE